ncbi:hypothetical protein INT45_004073 [Circinella minor]|uniref:Uncharacterized protein n=1 Tax=Circinella minor TaxID=1195481 RepID=A0A8H7RU53_9FUNG|nr:hypothetical protein INT45_004073 [Circinella minor]
MANKDIDARFNVALSNYFDSTENPTLEHFVTTEISGNPDWYKALLSYINNQSAGADKSVSQEPINSPSSSIPSKSSPSSTTTTNSSRHLLSESEIEYINSVYQGLSNENMWTLSTGTKVEKVMQKCASENKLEQGAHSLIIDPLDPVWEFYFTDDEREELSNFKAPKLPPMSSKMEEYLQEFDDLVTWDELWKKVNELVVDIKKDPEVYWLRTSIINALELYHCDFFKKGVKSEADILHRVWRIIYLCFDNDSRITVTSGEKTSYASALRKKCIQNDEKESPRRFFGTRTDLIFYTPLTMNEFGTTEIGLNSRTDSNKAINELELKCPKTMKDMLLRNIRLYPGIQRDLVTCGFNISGLYINQLVMDNPSGYVCRLSRLPEELQYPEEPCDFIELIKPILRIIYGTKVQMETTLKKIKNKKAQDGVLSYGFKKPIDVLPLPSCFTPIPTPRKRKPSTSSLSDNSLSSNKK